MALRAGCIFWTDGWRVFVGIGDAKTQNSVAIVSLLARQTSSFVMPVKASHLFASHIVWEG